MFTGGLEFVFGFNTTNAKPKSIDYWNGTSWKSIASLFDKISHNFDGKNTWYIASNVSVTAGNLYTVRYWLDIPINRTGKYDFGVYPSSKTLSQAISDDTFYFIDPWFNASNPFKINDTVAYSSGTNLTNFPYLANGSAGFNFDSPSATQYVWGLASTVNATQWWYYSNNTNYQLVNSTETGSLPFEIEDGNATSLNPKNVWDANFTLVVHMNQNNTGIGGINDSSIYGNNLTVIGMTFNTTGKVGNGYSANGMQTILQMLNLSSPSTSLDIINNLTLEAWLYPHGNSPTNEYIIAKNNQAGTSNTQWSMYREIPSNKTGCMAANGVTDTHVLTTTGIPNNQWTYIACTFDNSTGWKIYVNGNLNNTQAGGFPIPKNPNGLFSIGGANTSGSNLPFNGTIDEVRISNIIRSDSWIKATFLSINNTISQFGLEERSSYIEIDNPTNISYNIRQPLNFTLFNPYVNKCWYSFDNTENISLPNCANVSSLTGSIGNHNVTVYANLTNGTQIQSSTIFFTYDFSNLVVYAYDESNATSISLFTVTIANSTFSHTNSTTTGSITISSVLNNNTQYTITISSSGYGARNYVYTAISEANIFNAYLAAVTSSTHDTAIRVATLSGGALPNILITIQKFINGIWTNVSSSYTDDTGTVAFYLDSTVTYKLIIAYPTGTKAYSLQPAATSYTFFESGLVGSWSSIYQDLYWTTRPTNSVLTSNISQTINFTVYSTQHTILGARIRARNSTDDWEINATVTDNASATASLSLDLTGSNTNIIAEFYLNTSNADAPTPYFLVANRTFTVYNQPTYLNGTIEEIMKDIAQNSGININTLSLIALLITTLITGFIYSKFNASGNAILIAFVGILAIFTATHWFDFFLWAIVAIISGLYLIYSSGAT
jgi:hypothetical protein